MLLVGPNAAVGQSTTLHSLGVKIGAVVSGYEGNDYRPYLGYEIDWLQEDAGSPDIGFQIGFFYSRRFSKHWSLQPEFYFARRGLHFYKKELYATAYHLKAYYFQVPLLLKYRIFLAGPYAAIKLKAHRTIDIWGARDTRRLSGIRDFDYGLIFAISPEFSIGKEQFMLELRFDYGLARAMLIPKGYTRFYENPSPSRILAFTFLAGYRF